MLDPHKSKFHMLYWDIAIAASNCSVAKKAKVGAAVVTATGMISVGYNGMPAGMDNDCEYYDKKLQCWKTKPEVIHAERNALDKMARQGVSAEGSIIFVTRVPCIQCAKSILGLGIKAVYYLDSHRDMSGAELLKRSGICVEKESNEYLYPQFLR